MGVEERRESGVPIASRTGEPDGVSLRTFSPNDGVRGLTPPGSPATVEEGGDASLTLRVARL